MGKIGYEWLPEDILFVKEESSDYIHSEYQKGNLILEKTFHFALNVISLVERLESERKYVIARQVLKSGTAIGANAKEAQNAESKNDFVHKMKIAAKEADETEYWLLLCQHSPSYPDATELLKELKQISRILNKIISTSKSRR